ncbi:MAG: CDP-diacylglycerol--glycerol-3-phosphate 3-phosphatidyltransferase [Candidatus Omnitrophica bacterium]|jgi:CDP-diacylglycerol--glycerol-3-phosphate 3-phosphatidyltransferase|nr:CDP-diacylglycerol--glycerol-3-phosphate 3-phosphatidyltransferase [Candidatus Omnitrophota bacterium]MDD3274126.1 CDP-diacylglycerol--glycerol-3-phosphate 3-phosphatidyltransferase [Candidatus Omnitrophota bacterium]MDD5077824.1 CDP-diacylglycerol--glycerol-3-phosphate 3-phosphatidyltransferase [Candidatus Omnitrophota bacterium]MDD5724531.1 CDP-diacylglycerol--glycerol-3-phosphate 3-phosphatidyltransferase [Candidatus Omnitrophota bacterium]
MNLANRLTVGRIFLTFIFMFFLFCNGLWPKVLSLVVFILAAISDYLDGMIAHRRNMVTDFGRLMDPIADKILVLAAFAAFVQLQLIDAWMFVIIVSREILITSMRLFALNKGKVLSAARAGKHKTVVQMAVIFIILGFILLKEIILKYYTWNPAWEKIFRRGIFFLMIFTVALTLYSGLSYLWQNRKVIARL